MISAVLNTYFSKIFKPSQSALPNIEKSEGRAQIEEFIKCNAFLVAPYEQLLGRAKPDVLSDFLNKKDQQGRTILHLAVEYNASPAVIEYLVRMGAKMWPDNDGRTPLHLAIERDGDIAVYQALLLGLSPEERIVFLNQTSPRGGTILHFALGSDVAPAIIRLFIDAGALVTIPDNEGITPLHVACEACKPKEFFEHLFVRLDKETKEKLVNTKNSNEETALEIAINNKADADVIAFLIDAGADVTQNISSGGSLLEYAIACASKEIVVQLIEKLGPEETAAILKTQNDRGQTVFHRFVKKQAYSKKTNIQIIELILSSLNKSDQIDLLKTQDTQGKTVLHYAAEGGNATLFEYLRDKLGPEETALILKTQNEQGQTLFHELIESQAYNPETTNIQILELILSSLNKSDQIDLLNKQDIRGKTILHYAVEGNNAILLDYLREKCFAGGPDSRRIFDKRDEMGKTPLDIALRKKKEKMRTRKWQLGPDQQLNRWFHKNNHTDKFALNLYPEYDPNQAMEVIGKAKEYLLSISDHFNLLTVKSGCVEEAISALYELGNKISLLHINGHGPGTARIGPDLGYLISSKVAFGDPVSKVEGIRTPFLEVGNQAWLEALTETMEVGGTIIFDSCGLGRPEEANLNIPQETALKLRGKDITVIASSVDVSGAGFSYDPQAPERVRFFDGRRSSPTWKQDTTVVLRS